MRKIIKPLILLSLGFVFILSCKKSNSKKTTTNSPIVGFWTYKEDANIDYWNGNVLFKDDGTFRMYTALSLADTAAAQALLDTANQVVTFGTYTVNGTDIEMKWQEFNVIDFTFSGILNSAGNNIVGSLKNNQPGADDPSWYLTKP
jgi:hypothetical protein